MTKKSFVKGAAILAAAGLLVKVLGAVFRIPLANIVTSVGMANYGVAYPIYAYLVVISTAGLPSAMAASLIHPDRKVMAICRDGGFMMNSQEMETAMRLGLDLVVLVLNDNGFGMIKWKQANMGFDDWGLEFGNPDFVKYAESYGAVGHRIAGANALEPLLKKCHAEGGLHLIEVPIDYSDSDRILNHEIKSMSAQL